MNEGKVIHQFVVYVVEDPEKVPGYGAYDKNTALTKLLDAFSDLIPDKKQLALVVLHRTRK